MQCLRSITRYVSCNCLSVSSSHVWLCVSCCQGIGLIPESEWAQFLSTLREDLPAAFRITGHRALAECVLACLEQKYFKQLTEVEVDGERVPPPHCLPW